MGRSERLKMLFEQDETLLGIHTGLKAVVLSEQEVQQEYQPDDQKLEDQKPEDQAVEPSDEKTPNEPSHEPEEQPEKQLQHPIEETAETLSPSPTQAETKYLPTGSFCPLIAVSRFPYKYIKGDLSQPVASAFFDGGKFWQRAWDVYYIHVPPHLGTRPLLLVPAAQVLDFLKEINRKFECTLSLPDNGLVVPFHNDGTPQPSFIGQCTSKEIKDELETKIPPLYPAIPESLTEEFNQKIETAIEATKNKKKSSKSQKRQQMRLLSDLEWTRVLRRTQCYLGLHMHMPPELIEGQTWDAPQSQSWETQTQDELNINDNPPFPFLNEPIFISFDVESNERCHTQVTEVGISTLDTLDLVGIPPGKDAINWRSRIRSRHFRVGEYGHVINKEFVKGCPGSFEFGESEWVELARLVSVVECCFQPPYSHGQAQDGLLLANPEHKHRPRNLVLVGHNPSADINLLHGIGMTFFDQRDRFIDMFDTAEVYRVMRQEANGRSLGAILGDLDMVGWNLHNAGNDARYTLEVMLGVCCREVRA